jgi:hypothetical protein
MFLEYSVEPESQQYIYGISKSISISVPIIQDPQHRCTTIATISSDIKKPFRSVNDLYESTFEIDLAVT